MAPDPTDPPDDPTQRADPTEPDASSRTVPLPSSAAPPVAAPPLTVRQLIGWNLRRLRVERGLSQEGLALASSIDRSYVGRVERGSENVTVSTLEAFAAVLGVSVATLFAEPAAGAPRPAPMRSGRKAKGAGDGAAG